MSVLCCLFVAFVGADRVVEGVPEFGGDEEVPPSNHSLFYALCNGCSDVLLVFVDPCSIDVPISCADLARLIESYVACVN